MTENTSLFDLIIACWRGIKRFFAMLWQFFCKCIRLSWRQWYIVVPLLIVGIALGWWRSEQRYKFWKVEATAMVNCGTTELVSNRFTNLNYSFPADWLQQQNRAEMLQWEGNPGEALALINFRTFPIVDCLADSIADYIDYKNKSSMKDTLNVRMPNRLRLQFLTRDLNSLPKAEEAILAYLNNDPQINAAYQAHLKDLQWEADFCEKQVNLLDSFTYDFYFNQGAEAAAKFDRWDMFVGKREIHLLHDDILALVEHKKKVDRELSLATAPVVLESGFMASPAAVNRRSRMLVGFTLVFWVLGLLIAACVEQRKTILAWLRQ